jgi:hypothetical protein
MAAEKNTQADILPAEKESAIQVEYQFEAEGKGAKIDYSGAHEKTDPEEIALVRKLDWWIMPMYVVSDTLAKHSEANPPLLGYGACTG